MIDRPTGGSFLDFVETDRQYREARNRRELEQLRNLNIRLKAKLRELGVDPDTVG